MGWNSSKFKLDECKSFITHFAPPANDNLKERAKALPTTHWRKTPTFQGLQGTFPVPRRSRSDGWRWSTFKVNEGRKRRSSWPRPARENLSDSALHPLSLIAIVVFSFLTMARNAIVLKLWHPQFIFTSTDSLKRWEEICIGSRGLFRD